MDSTSPQFLNKRETIIMNQNIGGLSQNRLIFTIGCSYFSWGLVGALRGISHQFRQTHKVPTQRALVSLYLNSIIQNGLRYANYAGAASFLFCMVGFGYQQFFEEELDRLSNFTKNVIYGFTTGVLFKYRRGFRGAVVGGVLGGAAVGAASVVADALRKMDWTTFELRFDD